jgi:hypothetical protein
MIWYVAIIALLNLGLGYALAVLLGAGTTRTALAGGDASEFADASDEG